MKKFVSKLLLFTTLAIHTNNAFSGDIGISENTMKIVKSVLGNHEIELSDKIKIRVGHLKGDDYKSNHIEGDEIRIKARYDENLQHVTLVGVFIDGNKNPLVATIKPGPSLIKPSGLTKRSSLFFTVEGKADSYCSRNYLYKALVVIKLKNKLIAKSTPFKTMAGSFCG